MFISPPRSTPLAVVDKASGRYTGFSIKAVLSFAERLSFLQRDKPTLLNYDSRNRARIVFKNNL